MPKPTTPKKSPKKLSTESQTQRERFEQFAREHGATEDVLDKAMGEVAKAAKKRQD